MNKTSLTTMVALVLVVTLAGCGPQKSLTVKERRQVVANREKTTLEQLYKEAPEATDKIAQSPGYGVFSNANVNLLIASAGGGYGVVVDNAAGKRTYVKMALGG